MVGVDTKENMAQPLHYRPSIASFTGPGSVRFPAPDVARGFMLLLIAVANVSWWMPSGSALEENAGRVDQIWLLIRTGVVDQRAYPLFAALFGFGLMTMVNRRVAADIDRGVPPYWAFDSARRLIRRRGWWMLLFGLVHALIFMGDIIGTYALLAAIFAGVLTRKQYRLMAGIGSGALVAALAFALLSGISGSADITGMAETLGRGGLFMPLLSILLWAFNSPMTLLVSTVIPAAFIGARLADTDILANPAAHRSRLALVATAGLGIGFAASLPLGLRLSGIAVGAAPAWAWPLNTLAGLAGAFGWLALLTLFAGNPPVGGHLSGIRQMLSAIGQRSMTAYVGQSVLFALFFAVARWTGISEYVTTASGALIALAVWLILGLLCQVMASRGTRGPLEVLLRRAVARGED